MKQLPGKQQTFGTVEITRSSGYYDCEKVVSYDKKGNPVKCGNKSAVKVFRKEGSEYFCKIHSKKSWLKDLNLR